MSQKKTKERKSSLSNSDHSFHSIEMFRTSPFDRGGSNRYPVRPIVNILLIFLATFEVFLLVHSRIYLRGDLVRTFLSVYVDENRYPNLFAGEQFYLKILNVEQLSQHFTGIFDNLETIDMNSLIDMDFANSRVVLHVQYSIREESQFKKSVYNINIKQGITEPFNMKNLTDIQLFLLQIQRFQIKVDNLTVKQDWEGFTQKYIHTISYSYTDSLQMKINFNFKIDDAMMDDDDSQPQQNIEVIKQQDQTDGQLQKNPTFPVIYIIRARFFYGIVLVLAFISLYLNYISIRTTYKVMYEQLGHQLSEDQKDLTSLKNLVYHEDQQRQTQDAVKRWVKANKMTLSQLKLQHFFHILEFDIVFSTLSNIFQIISGFYLIYGIERERIAGIACLFSWMTIFNFVRKYKQLVLMYELIKLSIAKVIKFFMQFLPVFISYAILGVCLFPKVSFYSSFADSVTTLVCLMMGDSIEMITSAMRQKNSDVISIIYIFSFVLMFMHAIHNTLTSIIKQFFIIKKLQLLQYQKEKIGDHQKYLYIQQLQLNSEKFKRQLPIKLTLDFQKQIYRVKRLLGSKWFSMQLQYLEKQVQEIGLEDSVILADKQVKKLDHSRQEIERRHQVLVFQIKRIKEYQAKPSLQDQKETNSNDSPIKDSLLTEEDRESEMDI